VRVTVQREHTLVITADGEAGWIRRRDPLARVAGDRGIPLSGKGSTAVSSGYTAEWSVTDGQLWLTAILDPHRQVWPAAMTHLFGDQQPPILATWFSGRLVVALGEPIGWTWPRPFASSVELVLDVERGVVISSRRQEPGLATVLLRGLPIWSLAVGLWAAPIILLLMKCGH
jgi:hypothetical protein